MSPLSLPLNSNSPLPSLPQQCPRPLSLALLSSSERPLHLMPPLLCFRKVSPGEFRGHGVLHWVWFPHPPSRPG